jgi:hypothetical protein
MQRERREIGGADRVQLILECSLEAAGDGGAAGCTRPGIKLVRNETRGGPCTRKRLKNHANKAERSANDAICTYHTLPKPKSPCIMNAGIQQEIASISNNKERRRPNLKHG